MKELGKIVTTPQWEEDLKPVNNISVPLKLILLDGIESIRELERLSNKKR